MDGTDLALCVYERRPEPGWDAATWIAGVDVTVVTDVPVDIATRAGRFAKANGLPEVPQDMVTVTMLLGQALCWSIDDCLISPGREIFSVFVADGMPIWEARAAARLLSGGTDGRR